MLKVEESQGLYTFKFKPKPLEPLKKKKNLKNWKKKINYIFKRWYSDKSC